VKGEAGVFVGYGKTFYNRHGMKDNVETQLRRYSDSIITELFRLQQSVFQVLLRIYSKHY
jgi:hypothetical protein